MTFRILWDNGHDCGLLSGSYDTETAAKDAAEDWLAEMLAIETTPEARADAEEAYSYEVVEREDEPSEDDAEEAAAAEEQSLDYFNRYIAGDKK